MSHFHCGWVHVDTEGMWQSGCDGHDGKGAWGTMVGACGVWWERACGVWQVRECGVWRVRAHGAQQVGGHNRWEGTTGEGAVLHGSCSGWIWVVFAGYGWYLELSGCCIVMVWAQKKTKLLFSSQLCGTLPLYKEKNWTPCTSYTTVYIHLVTTTGRVHVVSLFK